ncbi:MAG: CpaF family protein [Candidatus Micrarchaeota archaeon]|nr:CpaF family protein [Candidatus Micrarchaeota archaeon]
MDEALYQIEDKILDQLEGKFVNITNEEKRRNLIISIAKTIAPDISADRINSIINDINDLGPITQALEDENVEDVMINNTNSIYVYDSKLGQKRLTQSMGDKEDLDRFVKKLKVYATNQAANGNIMDVHLPAGSRVNIVSSPMGYDVTIRNFKRRALSVLDLINNGELDYQIAARLWLYVDGFRVRPANLLIGGMPASGKTTLLNSMFSFFRPEQRIITIEETYELDTSMHENTVRLETSEDLTMEDLVKNSLRMRPDLIIIGEVRGAEANDMITAMNIGKICMGTIHASSTRDVVNRLQHTPMNVPRDIVPVIDALLVVSQVYENNMPIRKVVQMSEISGVETQILLSDLYKFDYKTHTASPILPSVTYRDALARMVGVQPPDILAEERVRAIVLEALNKRGLRDIRSVSEAVKRYYDTPDSLFRELGLSNIAPVIRR